MTCVHLFCNEFAMFMPGGLRTMRTIRTPRAYLHRGPVVRLSPAIGQKPAYPCTVPGRAIAAQAAEETFADATVKFAFVDDQINEFPTQSGSFHFLSCDPKHAKLAFHPLLRQQSLPGSNHDQPHFCVTCVDPERRCHGKAYGFGGDSTWCTAGVYAVYDSEETLRFVGVSRNISMTIQNHSKVLGDTVHSIKASVVENATKDELLEAWKAWLQGAVDVTGVVPPGNAQEKELWQPRRKPAVKPEIKLTAGKGIEDLTCTLEHMIDLVVKNEKTVVFIKGTRTQPQCGFSYQMLTTLNGMNTDYQVVNVLDEVYNPGLREAIKGYSAWPTIPQLYVDGEFVGGSDIVQEMAGNGELAKVLNGSS